MQDKVGGSSSITTSLSPFHMAPKRFNSIDVGTATCKLIDAIMYTVVFVIAYINEAIIASPSVGMNHAF